MTKTADIFTTLKEIQTTLLDQLQRAAETDHQHYEITALEHLQVEFRWDTSNRVTYSGRMQIYPKQLITSETMRYFIATATKKLKMGLGQLWEVKDSRTGNIGAGDYREWYTFKLDGKFTPNESPELKEQLVLAWEEVEDLTSFAVYESADLPEMLLYEMLPYHMVEFDSEMHTATYQKGQKLYK